MCSNLLKACKVCGESLVEDEYHLLFTCSTYTVIHESYDDILKGGGPFSIKHIVQQFMNSCLGALIYADERVAFILLDL